MERKKRMSFCQGMFLHFSVSKYLNNLQCIVNLQVYSRNLTQKIELCWIVKPVLGTKASQGKAKHSPFPQLTFIQCVSITSFFNIFFNHTMTFIHRWPLVGVWLYMNFIWEELMCWWLDHTLWLVLAVYDWSTQLGSCC